MNLWIKKVFFSIDFNMLFNFELYGDSRFCKFIEMSYYFKDKTKPTEQLDIIDSKVKVDKYKSTNIQT